MPPQILIHAGFKLFDTYGLPLAVQIEAARKYGAVLSVPSFYADAIEAGWKKARALAVIEEALIDTGAEPAYVARALQFLYGE